MKLYIYHTWIPGIDKWEHIVREKKETRFCHQITEVDFNPPKFSPEELNKLQKKQFEKNIQECQETMSFWEKQLKMLEAKLPTNNEEK